MNFSKKMGMTCILISFAFGVPVNGQNIGIEFDAVEIGTDAGLRGLDVVDENVIWASGGNQTVARTVDGGKTWQVKQLSIADKLEFRDVEGFSGDSAVLLSAGTPGLVLETANGGKDWTTRYRNDDKAIFFDAFSFWNRKSGIAFSDPLNKKLKLIKTADGGKSWTALDSFAPKTLSAEAGFAASGTCLTTQGSSNVWVGLGGKPTNSETEFARILYSNDQGVSWSAAVSTIPRSESAGIFSLCFVDAKLGFAIGGDYKVPEGDKNNFSITTDGGKTWRSPKKSFPTGFRSCIAAAKSKYGDWILIATGTNGTDLSLDQGETWKRASDEGFHAIAFTPGKLSGWASGAKGKMARFSIVNRKTR